MSDSKTITMRGGEVLAGFGGIASQTDVLICDVWGVVHNGQKAHAGACAALERFRAGGGTVIMVSNSPRPSGDVIPQMMRFGVTRASFDDIITSGDLTRGLIMARRGQTVLHLGPERDRTLFEGLDVVLSDADAADYCVCTGYDDDETQTPADYADVLALMARRKLVMICANPDLVVERGDRLIPCAGAMAGAFEKLGGEAIYAGKPHRPVYVEALAMAARLRGVQAPLERTRAVGDAIRTDITGAVAMGLESILLFEGIHWADAGGENWPGKHRAWLETQAVMPRYVMPRLIW